MKKLKKLTKENAAQEISSGVILIEFYGDWCPPCKALQPTVQRFAEENPEYNVGKINIDEDHELAQQFRVMSIPTLIVFKDGVEIDRLKGNIPFEELETLASKAN